MDELDTQLMAELESQKEAPVVPQENNQEGQEPTAPEVTEESKTQEVKEEAKTFSEEYVKALRAENARQRIENRTLRQGQVNPQAGYEPQGQQGQPQPIYDPRVDDMILSNKLSEIKADPYFGELFNEVDEEGITFEERLLEKALDLNWPVSELDALVFKLDRNKLLGKVKQKGIDEAYKSISSKAQNSVDKSVSSGKNIEDSKVESVDDAIKKAMKENGVTSLTDISRG